MPFWNFSGVLMSSLGEKIWLFKGSSAWELSASHRHGKEVETDLPQRKLEEVQGHVKVIKSAQCSDLLT